MKYALLVRPEAERDLRRAYSWYEDRSAGLGNDFLLHAEDALGQIQMNPFRYPEIHRQVRRALVHRFPYAIFYIAATRKISVIAVFHCGRNPIAWQRRLADAERQDDET